MKTTDTNLWLDKAAMPDINQWYRKYNIPVMPISSAAVYRAYANQKGASK